MTPVFQTISDPKRGDCHRAAIASLFDLEIEQVPHFRLFSDSQWFEVFCSFIWGLGYEVGGTGYFPKFTPRSDHLDGCNVNGFVEASVKSRNFEGCTHAVIIDLDGNVVHDPSPVKENSYTGENVIESGALESWTIISKRNA